MTSITLDDIFDEFNVQPVKLNEIEPIDSLNKRSIIQYEERIQMLTTLYMSIEISTDLEILSLYKLLNSDFLYFSCELPKMVIHRCRPK